MSFPGTKDLQDPMRDSSSLFNHPVPPVDLDSTVNSKIMGALVRAPCTTALVVGVPIRIKRVCLPLPGEVGSSKKEGVCWYMYGLLIAGKNARAQHF